MNKTVMKQNYCWGESGGQGGPDPWVRHVWSCGCERLVGKKITIKLCKYHEKAGNLPAFKLRNIF